MLWKANIDVEDIDDRQNMRFRIPSRVMSSVLDEANLSQSFKNWACYGRNNESRSAEETRIELPTLLVL